MPFTTQEKAEVLKTVQASQKLEAGVLKLAKIVQDSPAGGDLTNWPSLTNAINSGLQQMFWTNVVIQNLLWVFENLASLRLERSQNIAKAWTTLDGVINQLTTNAMMHVNRVPAGASAAEDFKAAISILQSIDRSLPYAEPFPESYPRIIGPHGHYEMAQSQICLSVKYMIDAQFKFAHHANMPNWPNTFKSNHHLGIVYAGMAKSWSIWNRVMCMQGDVVLPGDMASAMFDHEASTKLRPPSFFLALIAHELVMSRITTTAFSGRNVPVGISSFFRDILNSWREVLAEVDRVDHARGNTELASGGGALFSVAVFWSALDQWSQANLGFFFEIPAAPGQQPNPVPAVIPSGFFAQQASALTAIANQAEAVRLDLISKEGQPV